MAAAGRQGDALPHLVVNDVHFGYPEAFDDFKLTSISFKVFRGKCLVVLGANESGKSTLAALVLGRLRPRQGTIHVSSTEGPRGTFWSSPWTVCALLGAGCGLAWRGYWMAGMSAVVLCCIALFQGGRRSGGAVHRITSEDAPGNRLPPHRTIEAVLCERMPKGRDAREAAVELLERGGFQLYTEAGRPWGDPAAYLRQGVTIRQLSGGQRHLVYALAQLAAQPELLVCDEILCGLDLTRKARLLALIKAQQRETNMAVLYLTVDYAAAAIMADDFIFLHKGTVVVGPVGRQALDNPTLPLLGDYVRESKALEQLARDQHLRAEYSRHESNSATGLSAVRQRSR